MKLELAIYFRWIINTPYRAIDRAYDLSKKIRNIDIHYVWYKYNRPIESRNLKIMTYIDIVLEEYASKIYWALLEFQISKIFIIIFNIQLLEDIFGKKNKGKSFKNQQISFDNFKRKILWIEAVLTDIGIPKQKYQFYPITKILSSNSINNNSINSNNNLLEIIPYESVGLVPRSITRTLIRFQNELLSISPSIILAEFRLVKYQAIASIQYLVYLIIVPCIVSQLSKLFFLEPIILNYWNTNQYHIFLNYSEQEEALKRLQQIEELIWLDIILNNTLDIPLQELSIRLHQKTIELAHIYNSRSIQTIVNLFTDLIQIFFLLLILIWGKKRLAIFNSWVQEIFYSLSDTMKAFFILLCTDLCIGFHSPHGWEIFIASLLDHFAFSHNPYIISCLVSTFPVILDTVFKYWIFRHLNRISPSIVVTYHTMNE